MRFAHPRINTTLTGERYFHNQLLHHDQLRRLKSHSCTVTRRTQGPTCKPDNHGAFPIPTKASLPPSTIIVFHGAAHPGPELKVQSGAAQSQEVESSVWPRPGSHFLPSHFCCLLQVFLVLRWRPCISVKTLARAFSALWGSLRYAGSECRCLNKQVRVETQGE